MPDEAALVERIRGYRILHTAAEPFFDRIASLAARAFGAPCAVLALRDGPDLWFKARLGIEHVSVPRAMTLCNELLVQGQPLIVPDASLDPRFAGLPMVTQPPYVRFYAGVPLVTHDGMRIGSLCAIDPMPHAPPLAHQMEMLTDLAELAVDEMERRRHDVGAVEAGSAAESSRGLYAAYVAKSEFLSSLSHELRTPLNAITGYASLIAAADDTPRAAAEHAGEVLAAARHMLSLVNDVLEYSRLEAGALPIGWREVALRQVVEESLRMVAPFATSRGVTLHRDLDGPEFSVRADPVRIKQVLLNLLTNAIKFTPRGGAVTASLIAEGDALVRIRVRDTGIGIAEADIPKALTPFGQVITGTDGKLEGTGLGLPIAKALVERQGGTLTITSRVGQGTAVDIALPVLRRGRPGDSKPGDPNKPGGYPRLVSSS